MKIEQLQLLQDLESAGFVIHKIDDKTMLGVRDGITIPIKLFTNLIYHELLFQAFKDGKAYWDCQNTPHQHPDLRIEESVLTDIITKSFG